MGRGGMKKKKREREEGTEKNTVNDDQVFGDEWKTSEVGHTGKCCRSICVILRIELYDEFV